ncbi:UBN2 domain-containing protein, partial [Cephalotus follicularis]
HDYKMFTMNENEDIKSMFTRFTNIINALQSLYKTHSNSEMVRKILRCLPRSWMPKVQVELRSKMRIEAPEPKKEELTCFDCNKSRHFKNECPNLKKKQYSRKKKVMIATWSDSDETSSDKESNDEEAQLALIAFEEEYEGDTNVIYDELISLFEKLCD